MTDWEYVLDAHGNPVTDADGDWLVTNAAGELAAWDGQDLYEPNDAFSADQYEPDPSQYEPPGGYTDEHAANAVVDILHEFPGALDHIRDDYPEEAPEPQTFSEAIDKGLDEALAESKAEPPPDTAAE